MARTFTHFATSEVRRLLATDRLAPVAVHDPAMRLLGEHLARSVLTLDALSPTKQLCLVCAAEDADFLARGVLDGFAAAGLPDEQIKMICLWSETISGFDGDAVNLLDIKSVVKEYRESVDIDGCVVLVVSSTVFAAHSVEVTLANVLRGRGSPFQIIVATPLISAEAAQAIGENNGARRRWVAFAIDDQDRSEPGTQARPARQEVGSVPDIVKQRRRLLTH